MPDERSTDTSVAERIRSALPALTPAERRVGTAVLGGFPSTALLSSQAIAEASGTSAASVVRFVTKLGYQGMADFQAAVRGEVDRRLASPFELYQPANGEAADLDGMARLQVGLVTETLARLSDETITNLSQLLLASRQVLLLGGRFSLSCAHYLYAHLLLFRPRVTLLNSPFAGLADQLVDVGRRSCVVVFDFRRFDAEAAFAAEMVRQRRGKVVVVTDPYLSPAAASADEVVVCSTERPGLLDSYTAVTAVVDAVVSAMWRAEPERLAAHLDATERAQKRLQQAVVEDEDGATDER